jgi:uncharacterized membrane protein YhdT
MERFNEALRQTLGFTVADLEANRNNHLSRAQITTFADRFHQWNQHAGWALTLAITFLLAAAAFAAAGIGIMAMLRGSLWGIFGPIAALPIGYFSLIQPAITQRRRRIALCYEQILQEHRMDIYKAALHPVESALIFEITDGNAQGERIAISVGRAEAEELRIYKGWHVRLFMTPACNEEDEGGHLLSAEGI